MLVVALSLIGEVLLFTPLTPGVVGWDFNSAYEAARTILHGGNPYLGEYVNAPSLALLAVPLTILPEPLAYLVFVIGSIAAIGVLSGLLARAMGWSQPILVAVLVTTSWTATLSFYLGKPEPLLFAASAGAVLLIWRGALFWAGALVGFLLVKPTVTWPILVFLALALWPERRAVARYLGGLAASTVIFVGLGFWDIPRWISAVLHYSKQIGSQGTMAGLDGLLHVFPAQWGFGTGLSSPFTWGVLAIGLVGLAWVARRVATPGAWSDSRVRVAWAAALPVAIWILVTPYAHTYDDVFLIPLLLLIVGADAHEVRRPVVAVAALALAIFPGMNERGMFLEGGPSLAPLAAMLLVALGVLSMRVGGPPGDHLALAGGDGGPRGGRAGGAGLCSGGAPTPAVTSRTASRP